jgi:hypothetical protein
LRGGQSCLRNRGRTPGIVDASSGNGSLGQQLFGASEIGPRGVERCLTLGDRRREGGPVVATFGEARLEASQDLPGGYTIADRRQLNRRVSSVCRSRHDGLASCYRLDRRRDADRRSYFADSNLGRCERIGPLLLFQIGDGRGIRIGLLLRISHGSRFVAEHRCHSKVMSI